MGIRVGRFYINKKAVFLQALLPTRFQTFFACLQAAKLKFFAVRKIFVQAGFCALGCASLVHLEKEKTAVAPAAFLLIKWRDHLDASAGARGEFLQGKKRAHPLAPCNGVFRFGPQGQYEENVTFEKVTKLPSLVSARNYKFSPFQARNEGREQRSALAFGRIDGQSAVRRHSAKPYFNEFQAIGLDLIGFYICSMNSSFYGLRYVPQKR